MPYENERANPSGYSSLVENELVLKRLATFSSLGWKADAEIIASLPMVQAMELEAPVEGSGINHVITIDGSLQAVQHRQPTVEVGFIKVGVVIEKLKRLRALAQESGATAPSALTACYDTYSIEGVLPGAGVVDVENKEHGLDKLRRELFITMSELSVDPQGMFKSPEDYTLLEVVLRLLGEDAIEVPCPGCRGSSLVGVEPTLCKHCGKKTLFITDVLRLHETSTSGGSYSPIYNEAMSTFERIAMAGLLYKASASGREDAFRRTAFITDGPLALFTSYVLVKHLKDQIRELPLPLLAGFEKTGQFMDYAMRPEVQEQLEPGSVVMITNDVAKAVAGAGPRYGTWNFYGRRFIYRTLDGNKTFIFFLPSDGDNDESWDSYPTLRTFCELIEETKTDTFGLSSASLTSVAKANEACSIPLHLGRSIFDELLDRELGKSPE